jgi:transcription antitermination factor NusG
MPALSQTSGTDQELICPDSLIQWFALRVRSNFERPVSDLLNAKGVEEFLPTYRSRRMWSDRIREVDVPLFPGYVFCRIPAEARGLVLATTGVVNIVGVQHQPLPIADEEIAAVRKMIMSRAAVEPWPFTRVGQLVKIRSGSLAGVEGILLMIKDSCRLVISISILGRSVAVEIDAAYIVKV